MCLQCFVYDESDGDHLSRISCNKTDSDYLPLFDMQILDDQNISGTQITNILLSQFQMCKHHLLYAILYLIIWYMSRNHYASQKEKNIITMKTQCMKPLYPSVIVKRYVIIIRKTT